jgi:hypothetical protein
MPVNIGDVSDPTIATTLAQILSINLLKTGKYAIYPRDQQSISQIQAEHENQLEKNADDRLPDVGHGDNPHHVLQVEASRIDSKNVFKAVIINIQTGVLDTWAAVNYDTLNDGIRAMETLAVYLTGGTLPDKSQFWSVGASVGTSFNDPLIIATVHGTIAPLRHMFVELGCDVGFVSMFDNVDVYYSVYPFVHVGYFRPFAAKGGWYLGTGGGYMIKEYTFSERSEKPQTDYTFAADLIGGVNIGNFFDISYTLRTNFNSVSHKLSVGFVYRFK